MKQAIEQFLIDFKVPYKLIFNHDKPVFLINTSKNNVPFNVNIDLNDIRHILTVRAFPQPAWNLCAEKVDTLALLITKMNMHLLLGCLKESRGEVLYHYNILYQIVEKNKWPTLVHEMFFRAIDAIAAFYPTLRKVKETDMSAKQIYDTCMRRFEASEAKSMRATLGMEDDE